MNWLQEAFLEPTMVQAVIIISLVSALGLYLGRIKIFGISLGITFVFFAGILAGHLGIVVNKDMLYFAQSFGLILFVYALGLQVGPGFFSSLKKGGVAMNMMGLGVILLGLIMTVGLHWVTGVSLSNMVGLLCGAVTNTRSGRDLGDYYSESLVCRQETERLKGTTRHDYLCRRVSCKQSGYLRKEHQGRNEADGQAFRYFTCMEKR